MSLHVCALVLQPNTLTLCDADASTTSHYYCCSKCAWQKKSVFIAMILATLEVMTTVDSRCRMNSFTLQLNTCKHPGFGEGVINRCARLVLT